MTDPIDPEEEARDIEAAARLAESIDHRVILAETRSAAMFRRVVMQPVCYGIVQLARAGEPLTGATEAAAVDIGYGPWMVQTATHGDVAGREAWDAMTARLRAVVAEMEAERKGVDRG